MQEREQCTEGLLHIIHLFVYKVQQLHDHTECRRVQEVSVHYCRVFAAVYSTVHSTAVHVFSLLQGVPHVLVKLGSDGSLLLSRDASAGATAGASLAEIRQQVVPAPEVVDTTGAGDTFTAAFAVGLVEGMEHSKALQFACKCSTVRLCTVLYAP